MNFDKRVPERGRKSFLNGTDTVDVRRILIKESPKGDGNDFTIFGFLLAG